MKQPLFFAVAAVLLLGLVACRTPPAPEDIPEDLTAMEFFRLGQEATSAQRWETALTYYQVFLERNPEDLHYGPAAEYEIAFIHYKRGEYSVAERKFQDLLARYETPESDEMPEWPRILSERILYEIIPEETGSTPVEADAG